MEHRDIRTSPGERSRKDLLSLCAGRIVSLFLLKPLFLLGRKEARKQTPEAASCRTELRALFPYAFSLAPCARAGSADVEGRSVSHTLALSADGRLGLTRDFVSADASAPRRYGQAFPFSRS